METREIIIEKAGHAFMRLGIKSVSMDDLARELGMSKKTIYQHFKDKRELVNEVFEAHIATERQACNTCFVEELNAIQQLIEISGHVHRSLKGMNSAVLFDIQKYYPNCWNKFQAFSREFIFKNMKQNLLQGQKEGLYRDNFNPDIVASIYVSLVQQMVKADFIISESISVSEIQEQVINYHLYSICSPKGIEYLNQHSKQ